MRIHVDKILYLNCLIVCKIAIAQKVVIMEFNKIVNNNR